MEKRIATFKEFLQRKNEAVTIQCGWEEECVEEVLTELHKECIGPMTWDSLIQFCKDKWAILGREIPQPEYDDHLLTQHIKDLIFQFHGDCLFTYWENGCDRDNLQVHSKGVVIEKVASDILEKVKEEVHLYNNDDTIVSTLFEIPDSDDENWDDDELPFEARRPVKGMAAYTQMKEEE